MNSASRGVRDAFRNVIRTGSIVLILGLSIGLVIAMMSAKQAVDAKVEAIKSTVGNTVSVSPAGIRGFEGGGSLLTSEQIISISSLDHVNDVSSTLSDRLTTDDTTNLESGIEAGPFGRRMENQSQDNSDSSSQTNDARPPSGESNRPDPSTSIMVTGTNNVSSASTYGGSSVAWKSGEAFDAESEENVAVVGSAIAEKNDLSVGDTFTAYGEKVKVVGIYDAGNTFANNGVYMPLASLQKLSDQTESVSLAIVTVDSADNLESVTSVVESKLGDTADVTNNQETADATIEPLAGVSTIATYSLIGAIVAASVIVLLTMIMVVRERRREIGVMKAVGASNVGIAGQFIAEALTLTSLGLIIGLVVGIAASAPLTNLLVSNSTSTSQQAGPDAGGPRPGAMSMNQGFGRNTLDGIQSSVGLKTIIAGIGITFLIAILGSAFPAFLISKVKPAEAMRSE